MGWADGRREVKPEDAILRLVQENAAGLLRHARRHSLCVEDAQDAYQRALEILVRRMRSAPPEHPLSWLRTVIRNEAVTVRTQREQLVGRSEIDLDRHEDRHVQDPAERVAGFERLGQMAEALQRLKPQELSALMLRAEGHTYREIAERNQWTYTKVNRCITEGRRALLARLGAIESGAECERWLPLLSQFADGEATWSEIDQLRPHLRACQGCRATLRQFHGAPGQVAALIPVALVPLAADRGGALAGHAETVVHALLERATLVTMRLQGALDALPGTKLAAVAASTAAIAGGGAAIEQATQARERPRPAIAQSAAASPPVGRLLVTAGLPRTAIGRLAPVAGAHLPRQAGAGTGGAGEFTLENGSSAPVHHDAAAFAPTARASSTTSPVGSAPSMPPPHGSGPAEFAGP